MSALTLCSVAPEDWPALAAQFRDLTMEQSLTYARAAAARIGAEAQFVALENADGQPVAAACLRLKRVPGLGRGIAWIAAGPLTCRAGAETPGPERLTAILAALRRHAREAGHILRLRFPVTAPLVPGWPEGAELDRLAAGEGFAPCSRTPAYRTVLIALEQSEEALMAALHGKWRNPLRNALKAGLALERGPAAEYAERFHRLYLQVQDEKGFRPGIEPDFFYPLAGADFAHDVLIARRDGQDIAGMTIGRSGPGAVYLFGATAAPGRRLNAGHFLMWQAVLHCKALGLACFDLGGIDAEANPGVTRFKQRTGGMDLTAPGPYETRPPGIAPQLVRGLEHLHRKLQDRRKARA
ncbi:lipid II:glycine glycyltransferase FemX (plasmid) [Roseobacteraceae bacterium NS-SX3]